MPGLVLRALSVIERWLGVSPRPRGAWGVVHLGAMLVVAVVLPGGSLWAGHGMLAWTMFSQSASYRMTIVGTGRGGGEAHELDPRALLGRVPASMAAFLPSPRRWRYAPVGYTFRTGLERVAIEACSLAELDRVEVTLEERPDLDAQAQVTRARAVCR